MCVLTEGEPRGAQTRRAQESPDEPRRVQESPGEPGGFRRDQESPEEQERHLESHRDGAYVRSLRIKGDLSTCAQKITIRRRRGYAQPAQQREAYAAPGDHRWRVSTQPA